MSVRCLSEMIKNMGDASNIVDAIVRGLFYQQFYYWSMENRLKTSVAAGEVDSHVCLEL